MHLRRDRSEPTGQPLTPSRSGLPRPLLAAGAGVAALGVTLGAALWPAAGPATTARPAAAAADEQQDAARRAAAGRAAAALRIEERTSRDRTRTSPAPARPSAAAHAATGTRPGRRRDAVGHADVNVRSGPSARTTVSTASRPDPGRRHRRGTSSGWTQVVVDGRAGWVRSTFLSTTKPAPQPPKKAARPAARRSPAGVSDASVARARASSAT